MAETFLKFVLESLGFLIKEEIGLILGVDKEMRKLSSILTALQSVLEDAEDKQIESKPIQDWLRKLNVLAYEIDDILDECKTHISQLNHARTTLSRYSLKKILYRQKIARRMKQVSKKLEGVAAERAMFNLREMSVDRPREVAAGSRETGYLLNQPHKIYGRDEDRDMIVKMLLEDVKEEQEMSVLPIIGVGGLGKTTLAQQVFNDARVVDHFDKRIWVCVSDNFEIKSLVKAMIEFDTKSGRDADLQHLAAVERRLSELLSQKRYLIVLDDVWNEQQEKWFELKGILSCGSTGASIIVTTRQQKVARIMGTLPSHLLRGLSDEDCWMLLRQRAFGQEEVSPNLEIIGRQIVSKCAGVPLAAIALGGILLFKRREVEWVRVRESEIWKLSAEDSSILPVLRLSYHHLPLELRQCFAYVAAFPKDSYIEKEELILLWIAHGHISSEGTLEAEDVGNDICDELLLRSLLQTPIKNFISMHDLVHDLALSVMENKVLGVQSGRNIASSSTIRQVNLRDRNVLFPKTFQEDMNISSILELTSLRVLDASDTSIKDLPPSIGNLKHLRYLNLSSSEIRNLPNSLCTLWNLQILNLDSCDRLVALPKKLTYLHNLQHLYLTRCYSLSEMPPKMRELSGLKTLSMFIVGVKRGNQLEELQCLNLSGELEVRHLQRVKDYMDAKKANIAGKKNLRKLRLSWKRDDFEENVDDEKVLEALEPHPNLEYLSIRAFSGRYFPLWMKSSTLGKITDISLWDCKNCRRLPELGELPNLENLLLWKVGVEYIIEEEVGSGNPVKIQFPALNSLDLRDLPNLKGLSKGLSKGHDNNEAFPNLKKLRIQLCPSLILTPLSSLQKLEDLQCNISTLALFSEQDTLTRLSVQIEKKMTCFPIETVVKLSNLKDLNINGAKEISVTGEGLQALKKVQRFTLDNCEMTCIPDGLLRHLTALQILTIYRCPELTELSEEIKHFQNLRHIGLVDLPKVECLPQHLSSLIGLIIVELPELKSLPDQLTSLRQLNIQRCTKVVSLPALPNIKHLEVRECPLLERRYQREGGVEWHKIAHIPHLRIG